MNQREETFEQLGRSAEVPVLILGGGVNGVGLFRELALQGVDCLLVDKSDFVAGASSKTSRMIHGGLRYLESREFSLVRESLFERDRLLENAPHCVAPLKTTIPLPSRLGGLLRSMLIFLGLGVRPGQRGLVPVKFGLWFYDFITRKDRRTPRHYFTSRAESLRTMPGLRSDIVGTATYWDAWIAQAERLCIDLIRDARAAKANCRAVNYVRPQRVEDGAVVLSNELSGESVAVRPQVVVNATGAWVDITNETLGCRTQYMGGTKGSHLVVDCPALHEALDGRMVYYQYADGRVCIVFPFMDKVIMGSTDIRIDDPDEARCDADEIDYMLATLRAVFPDVNVSRSDIVFVFCGVRPLPASEGDVLATVSRGHSLHVIEPDPQRPFPVYCMVGGKWTTFRAFAEQAADRILARLGAARRCSTERVPIGGGKGFPETAAKKAAWIARVAGASGLDEARVRALLDRYGTSAESYATGAGAEDERPLASLPDYTAGEITRIATDEYVEHLTDIVCRRSTIALLGQADRPVLSELAGIAGAALGWDRPRQDKEIQLALDDLRLP
ncbi:MAG: glycerol-3-phosphate dehydrogenase/oxidase [Phycisphaerae bacterium]|nr:glycerol-3-phosphate dehydrogenase/oxidase [Phycisphaerae bacterium]